MQIKFASYYAVVEGRSLSATDVIQGGEIINIRTQRLQPAGRAEGLDRG